MIEAKCNKGDVEIHIKGDMVELSAETITLINAIYEGLFDEDVMGATVYRDFIENFISTAFTPVKEAE